MKYVELAERLLYEAGGSQLIAVTVAMIVVAVLLNVFARHRRREMRRAVLLYMVYFVGTLIQGALGVYGAADGALWLQIANDVVMALVVVHLGAIVILDLMLPAVAIELPTVVIDVGLGMAYLIAAGTVLSQDGINLTSFVAVSTVAAGILTISLQSTLGNVIGGLALQLDGSIEIGQWVQLENGRQGRISAIRWRHTMIETRDWGTLVVPNAVLLGSQILILGKREGKPVQYRMWVYFQVDFRYPPSRVISVVQDALRAAPIIDVATDPPPNCVCMDFARDGRESYALYAVRYWLIDLAVDDPTSSRVRERVFAALKRAEIPLANPILRVAPVEDSDAARMVSRRRSARKAIDTVGLFEVLNEHERDTLAERLVKTPFAAGEVMTKQGAVAHWLYILASGSAEIRRRNDAGVEQVVAHVDAPGFFGEMGLMTGDPRSASVIATSPCESYRLDKASFEAVIRERPEVAEALSALLARRRVEIALQREGGDASATERVIVEEAAKLVRRVRSFFGLEEG